MKKLFALSVILTALVFLTESQAQTPVKTDGAEITFTTKTHDFGEISLNTPVSFEFEFTNTGNEPLIIDKIQKPCSCQEAEYPKQPILPGKSGIIKTQYSANKLGSFNKMYTVFSTASNDIVRLVLKGTVVK